MKKHIYILINFKDTFIQISKDYKLQELSLSVYGKKKIP